MQNLTLYRKYRPKNFDEVVGQDEVVQILKNAIESGNLPHAFLFTGTRGVGKTSIARIFAKELGVSDKDIYELDAASNRKIEDFRELSDSVQTLPFESKYKVYIIDEVHMLTKEAFNAFLKTLEEPPSYVIFILATTELEKVPDTIVSRCQVLQFKRASERDIKNLIDFIAKQENFKIGDDAKTFLAFLAQGSYRDALSLLQKALAYANGQDINLDIVERALGAPSFSFAFSFLSALSKKDPKKAFEVAQKIKDSNADIKTFLILLADILRDSLRLRLDSNFKSELEGKYTDKSLSFIEEFAKSKSFNSKTLLSILNLLENLPFSADKSILLDIFVSEFFEED